MPKRNFLKELLLKKKIKKIINNLLTMMKMTLKKKTMIPTSIIKNLIPMILMCGNPEMDMKKMLKSILSKEDTEMSKEA
jgi:hypothetical protein